ncbi:MAG: cysteine desulfurase family protein, partial [Chromatiales bacterium]
MDTVYMDHHATTPVHPEVLGAMLPYFREEFGNPASATHAAGRRAADAVEAARESIAGLLGVRSREVLFTSGATESNNLALRGTVRAFRERRGSAHVLTCAVEHKSVLETVGDLAAEGCDVTVLPVDAEGSVDPQAVRNALRRNTCLVSIQTANGEIGTLQPLEAVAGACSQAGVPLHTDAAQAVGWLPLRPAAEGVSLLSASAHKAYGPKGVGVLWSHRRHPLAALMTGGGQERGRRSGTLNVPGIVGMARAFEIAWRDREAESNRLRALRERLWDGIRTRIDGVRRNGHPSCRLPHNLSLSFRHVEGESLLMALKGFALSSGSACSSTDSRGSHVIRAIAPGDEMVHGSIRVGLGRGNREEHVDALVEALAASVARLRA